MLMGETAECNDSPTWPNLLHFMASVLFFSVYSRLKVPKQSIFIQRAICLLFFIHLVEKEFRKVREYNIQGCSTLVKICKRGVPFTITFHPLLKQVWFVIKKELHILYLIQKLKRYLPLNLL